MVRIDAQSRANVAAEIEEAITAAIKANLPSADVVVAVGAEPGRTRTGSPQGSDCRQKMGPVRLDLATSPSMRDVGLGSDASRPDIT